MNLSLTKKLVSSFTIISLFTFVIAGIGIYSLSNIIQKTNTLSQGNIPAIVNIIEVKSDIDEVLAALRALMSTDLDDQEYARLNEIISSKRNDYKEHLQQYSQSITAGSEKDKLYQDYISKIAAWKGSNQEFEKMRAEIQALGMGDLENQLTKIEKFRGDHLNAQIRLENMVNNNVVTNFTGRDDECDFGKWLKETKTPNQKINQYLAQAADKHVMFHMYIKESADLYNSGQIDEARSKAAELIAYAPEVAQTIDSLIEELRKAQTLEHDMNDVILNKSIPNQMAADKSLANLVNYEITNALKNGEEANQLTSRATQIIVISSVVIFLSAIIIGVVLSRNICKPINNIINELDINSAEVHKASSHISATAQLTADGAVKQAAGLEEASANVYEMAGMIKKNAETSNEASHQANEVASVVRNGTESMGKMNSAISDIQRSAEETSKIIKVIDEIAFQTNLLALNAAVEAARAGESGKGFAVVAEEVRNLAMRSAEAARNTSTMIEESVTSSHNGVKICQEVDENLNRISELIQNVAANIADIDIAGQEQSTNIDQISKTMREFDKVTQSNAASAEESASASEELTAQANNMQMTIGHLLAIITGKNNQTRQTLQSPKRYLSKSDQAFHDITQGHGKADEFEFSDNEFIS